MQGNGDKREEEERDSQNHHFQMIPYRQLWGSSFVQGFFPSEAAGVKNFLVCCQIGKKNIWNFSQT